MFLAGQRRLTLEQVRKLSKSVDREERTTIKLTDRVAHSFQFQFVAIGIYKTSLQRSPRTPVLSRQRLRHKKYISSFCLTLVNSSEYAFDQLTPSKAQFVANNESGR